MAGYYEVAAHDRPAATAGGRGVALRPAGDEARPVMAGLMRRLDELTERLVTRIVVENPGYAEPSPVSRQDLVRSCRDNLQRVLQVLAAEVPAGVDAYDAARETGRRRAEQRLGLDALLRSYRLGGLIIWEALVEQAHAGSSIEPLVLLDAATAIWTAVDAVSSEVARSYQAAELELLRADEQQRGVLIDQLLHGRGQDRRFAEHAADALGLPAHGDYLVVAAERSADGKVGLHRPADALAGRGVRSTWQVRAEALVGLVALERRDAGAALGTLRRAVRGRVGVSAPVAGLAEVGVAYELALAALHTLPAGAIELTTLDDRLPQALLVQAPDLADRLVQTMLGPLLALPGRERDTLLETLSAWLAEHGSPAHTATRLYCHRNTVLNRLQRIETLIGRRLHDEHAHVALSLALMALQLDPNRIK